MTNKAWLNNGGIVLQNGKVTLCEECPCDTGTGTGTGTGAEPPVTPACMLCVSMPIQWTFSVSGVTDSNCSNCSAFNGTVVITHTAGCTFATENFDSCPAGTIACSGLNYSPGWYMTGLPGPPVLWELFAKLVRESTCLQLGTATYSCADFDCLTGGTFTRLTQGPSCTNFPSTIVVSPA